MCVTKDGRKLCDAEVYSLKNKKHYVCQRIAKWQRDTITGGTLHYCNEHKIRAFNPRPEEYTPAHDSHAVEIQQSQAAPRRVRRKTDYPQPTIR